MIKILNNFNIRNLNIRNLNIGSLKNNLLKLFLSVILILISVFVIKTLSSTAYYSYASEDDFTHAYQYMKSIDYEFDHNLLKAGKEYAIWGYNNWNGNYFSNFIEIAFGIIDRDDIAVHNQNMMLISIVSFFVSLYILIYVITSVYIMEKKSIFSKIFISSLIYSIFVVSIFCFNMYVEVFTWFSAATSYVFPLTAFFISFALLILNNKYKNIFLLIAGIVFAFISMGGSLEIVGLAGAIILAFIIYNLIPTDKISLSAKIILVVYLIFAIVNIKAPGNIERIYASERSVGVEVIKYDVIAIIRYAFDVINMRINLFRINFLMYNILKISSLFLGFAIYRFNEKKLTKAYYASVLSFICAPILTIIPVAICYAQFPNFYLPDRVCFPLDIAIVTIYMNIFLIISYLVCVVLEFLIKKNNLSIFIIDIATLVVIIFMTFGFVYDEKAGENFEEAAIVKIYNTEINNGYVDNFKRYHALIEELNKQVDEGKKDIVLSNDNMPRSIDGMKEFALENNNGIKLYYRLNSMQVK